MVGTLQKQMNSAAQWEVTLLANNPHKNMASGRYSDLILWYNGRIVFGGQCMGYRVNPDTSVTYSLCDDLAVLRESYIPPTSLLSPVERFSRIVDNHNSLVSPKKRIVLGDIWDDDSLRHWSNEYKLTWDFVSEHIEMFGGFVRIDRTDSNEKRLSWTKDGGHFNRQTVLFGDNIIDISYAEDANSVASCILAEGNDGITKTLTDPNAIGKYGRIWAHQKFDIDNLTELESAARISLNLRKKPIVNVTATAFDKSFFDENAEPISIGDFVKVRSRPHGVDGWFPVTSIQHDISGVSPPQFVCGGLSRAISANEARNNRFANWVRSVSEIEPTYTYSYAVDSTGDYAVYENNRAKVGVMD